MSAQDGSVNELSPLKRAFLAIDRLQARVRELEEGVREPIAVVGIGCRFPGGASTPAALSKLLLDRVDAVVEKPPVERPGFDADTNVVFPPAGYLREDVAAFDPMFFGTAPREAASMDPQQRLALECAWEALEDAGINPRGLEGSRSGVFVGVAATDWSNLQLRGVPTHDVVHSHFAAGVGHSMVSGRISYVLGLQGPSISIDTACSSSLVAVHLACQSLRNRECDLALAGGVNLILAPDFTIAFQQSRMLSGDGRCRTFDADATGFSRGEGCGVVVLKRLSDALRDGDRVLAVVKGSAVNQDGPSSGLTAPNGPAQEAVIRDALRAAGVDAASVSYVEAHGTGTILGDPIEVQALGQTYGSAHDPDRPLLIGSIKTNLGHLEAAAGVAGFIKAVLAVRDGVIPPQLHFSTPNPHIPWDRLPLKVVTDAVAFADRAHPRRAGISSFGFSGTNVHVIVEEPPRASEVVRNDADRSVHVLPLSAVSRDALCHLAEGMVDVLTADADAYDVCHTAGTGRAPLAERVAVIGSSSSELRTRLGAWLNGAEQSGVVTGRAAPEAPRVAFLYTGQGAQRPGMGRQLYETEPVFRDVLDRAADILSSELDQPLLPLLFGQTNDPDLLHRTGYAQPALVAIELGLSALWRSWGVRPDRVLGHSVGEYAAAIDAGIMNLEDGLRLIAARGRLMQALPTGGTMVAVFTSRSRLAGLLESAGGAVSLAAINAADSTVISGDEAAVHAIAEQLLREGVQNRRLAVSHAFHSHRMEPMLEAFREVAASIRYSAPRIPLISNLTGAPLTFEDVIDADYWCRHIRMPVLFADGVRSMHQAGVEVLLECGPEPTLSGMASRTLSPEQARCIPSLRSGRDEQQCMAEAVAAMFTTGVNIDWASRDAHRPHRRVALPVSTYSRSRLWFTLSTGGTQLQPTGPAWRGGSHPLLGNGIRTPDGGWIFERAMKADTVPFIADHVVNDTVIVPATAYIELLLAAAHQGLDWAFAGIENLTIREALILDAAALRSVQLRLERADDGRCHATIHSLAASESEFRLHAEATLVREANYSVPALDESGVRARCNEPIEATAFYAALNARGLNFGPCFRGVSRVSRGVGEAFAEVLPPAEVAETGYVVHPAVLDAGIQALAAALPGELGSALYLPIGLDRVRVFAGAGAPRRSHVRLENVAQGAPSISGSVTLYDEHGAPAVSIEGLHMVRTRSAAPTRDGDAVYRVAWETRARPMSGNAGAATEALVQRAENALAELGAAHGATVYGPLHEDLEKLSAEYFLHALQTLGWSPVAGEIVSVETVLTRCGIVGRYRPLVKRMLRVLEQIGVVVSVDADTWQIDRAAALPDPAARAVELLGRYTPHDAELAVTARCGNGLVDVLRGAADPLELLFPGGDTSAQARIYRDTPVAKTFNGALRSMIRDHVAEWPADRPLRILEIGAGTGGTTAHVIDVLPSDRVEYTFTDVGRLFVNRARDAFGDRPFMRFAVLDIDRDPSAQGFQPESYDVIIASNVLHATRDLRATLERVRGLLAPGGTLCLFEVTRARAWVDLTVGLTDGWWLFEDRDLRSENPVLTRKAWLELLQACGYRDVFATADGDATSGLAGQSIVVARRGGAAGPEARWLVCGDAGRTAGAFAARLREEGAAVFAVDAGDTFELHEARATVPTADATAFRALLAHPAAAAPTDVAVFWPADHVDTSDGASLDRITPVLASVLHLVQALVSTGNQPPRLHLVTRGAQPANGDVERVDAVQATVWGFARSLVLEHAELRARCIDLDPAASGWSDAEHAELTRPDDEPGVAFRNGERRIPRLDKVRPAATANGPQRLHYAASGSLEDLHFKPYTRKTPRAREVEIEILAAGLNFRDVVHALGVREDVAALGAECVGRIAAVGSAVDSLKVGDLVMAAAGAFGDFATIHADLAVRVPDNLSIAEAATLPIAFVTAFRALHDVAQMRRGQRILIHAAAGGVGLAAVQLAVAAGLEVYGTASTPEKRELVRSLGARDVFDSRSLSFENDVMSATNGAGVDLVLNSLAGDFIPASLRVISEGGALIELGKTGGWDDARVRQLEGVRAGVRYVVVDLTDDLLHQPAGPGRILQTIADRVATGELKPLPCRTLPMSRAEDAFRSMAAGRHTGKLVLVRDAYLPVRDDGAYLVTGGLAGLGLRVADHLCERGARTLVLAGRSSPSADAEAAIERMRAAGARVLTLQVDVADRDALERALSGIAELPHLRGVVHCAGVLRDAALVQQTWADFQAVLQPKVAGLHNLEALTRDQPLDFFLIYSSIAGTLGSPGQSNHAAANAFLDAAAVHRVARGRPAVSLAWGAWSEIGAAVRHGVNTRAARKGLGIIDPETGLALTEGLSAAGYAVAGIAPIQWEVFLDGTRVSPFLERVARMRRREAAAAPSANTTRSVATTRLLADELADTPPARRRVVLKERIRVAVRRVLGLAADHDVDDRQPLGDIGLDSLMAVELRNALGALIGRTLPATLLFDHPTVNALTNCLAADLIPTEPATAPEAPAAVSAAAGHADLESLLGSIEQLSQDEVERRMKGTKVGPHV